MSELGGEPVGWVRRPGPPGASLGHRRRASPGRFSGVVLASSLAAVILTGCSTYVSFVNAGPEKHPVLLFDGWRDGACRNDEVIASSEPGRIRIGRVLPFHPACPAEFVAFAQGMGAVARRWPGEPTDDAWLRGKELRIRFPVAESLAVTFWVLTPDGVSIPESLVLQIDAASQVFSNFRVGARLAIELRPLQDTPARESLFEGYCQGIDALRDAGLFSQGRVNVYVYFHSDAVDPFGRNCDGVDGRSDVIFLYKTNYSTTLAHELGHAMGLLDPDQGDVDEESGFTPPCPSPACDMNLMTEAIDEVKDVTLGQLFRMNLDSSSFWNRFQSAGPFPEMVRACQGGTVAQMSIGPCPNLALRQPNYP